MSRKPSVVYPNEYPVNKTEAPLWLAAKYGRVLEVIRLIASKKNIEERGGYMHCSPLAIASLNDHGSVVSVLLEHHANLLSIDSYFSETPLHCAVRHYNSRVKPVSQTNDQIIDLGTSTNSGVVPVTTSSILIQAMVMKGLTLDAVDECGRTALHLAVADRNESVVRRLLDNGADISLRDVSGSTVLKHSILENDHLFVKLLVEYGANINEIYNYGRLPLHLCVQHRFEALSKLLILHGADIEVLDFGGSSALALASHYGWVNGIEMIRLEIAQRAKLKIESK